MISSPTLTAPRVPVPSYGAVSFFTGASGTGLDTVFSSNALSFPTLTVAVSPPLTTSPGPPFDSSAPLSTSTISVTVPFSPAGTSSRVHVTTPPAPFLSALVSCPSFDASTNFTLASRVSDITISAASSL